MKLGPYFQFELKVVEIQAALTMGISFTKCKLLQKVVMLLKPVMFKDLKGFVTLFLFLLAISLQLSRKTFPSVYHVKHLCPQDLKMTGKVTYYFLPKGTFDV